ncbi:putative membrane protein [Corynebacterium deserti GIMN1.010]|uniref:Putative membrane protein n=1 Tax=Corynebacterium deserti GIMN1.010 TaxID=931089 RepID=A0A0M5IL92_9CORY|nr:hypothetical protein [Corynebacterium deserti]ALC05031.1 putative membrane protein [Corynebacterium deserti GIMN1.010]
MQNSSPVPVKILSVIYLSLFIVLSIVLPVSTVLDAFALGFILALSFVAAVTAAATTQKASISVLLCLGLVGLICVGVGIYFWLNVPEGIFDPLLIVIGGGVFIAQLILAINRFREIRGKEPTAS